jgi:3-oxoacyl-[acyl-carrier-protein] synthase II
MKERRVVVTGLGAVSPLGYGARRLFNGMRDGESAVKRMPEWEEYDGLRSLLAAPCELRGEMDIPRKFRRSMSPMSVMAAQAAEEALDSAGIPRGEIADDRCGCVTGSTMGSAKVINQAYELVLPEKDFTQLTSMMFFKCMAHSVSANLASFFSLKGAVMSTSAACASSLQAVGTAYDLIRCGRQDFMLCGGAEEVHPTVTGIFDLLYATSVGFNDDPEATPRPFDTRRDGLVCGEGAAILVLEEFERASSRGADILCEITGYDTGGSGDHVSQSNSDAMIRCMTGALREAGVEPTDIDYINAHATGTIQGDAAEAAAISAIFADGTPVSSLKGYIGHTMGASGAMELVASILMMRENIVLPGRNLEVPGDDCSSIQHPTKVEERRVSRILKNAFAFGGVNASIVCERI